MLHQGKVFGISIAVAQGNSEDRVRARLQVAADSSPKMIPRIGRAT